MTRCSLAFILLLLAPLEATALQCQISQAPDMDFGAPDPFAGGNITSSTVLDWTCSRSAFENNTFPDNNLFGYRFTMCVYLASDTNGGFLPRTMTSGTGSPAIPFNIYSSPAGAVVVQPQQNAIAVPVDLSGIFNFQDEGTVNLFGIINGPLPGNVASGVHTTSMANSQVTGVGSNQNCVASGTLLTTYILDATIDVPDQCQVTASDMDFGEQSTPLAQTNAESFIDVRCTNTTQFTVGLSNGLHAVGTWRRLSDGNGHFIDYNLYGDPSRNNVWGNDSASRKSGSGLGTGASIMMPVYGQIPADPTAIEGIYTDTITVDVEF